MNKSYDEWLAEGDALLANQQPAEARVAYLSAYELRGDDARLMKQVGNCHLAMGQTDEAVVWYLKAAEARPGYFDAAYNLGCAYLKLGNAEEGIKWNQRAIDIAPDSYEAWTNLGMLFFTRGEFERAVESLRRAIKSKPDGHEALTNLGNALYEMGHYRESVQALEQAIENSPESPELHFNLSHTLLALGELERGLREYEWRLKLHDYSPPDCGRPLWDGSSLRGGTLLLYTEQGLGDALCFIRYAQVAARKCGRLLVVTREPLRRLLETAPGVDQVLIDGRDSLPAFDAFLPVMSLPAVLKTTSSTIPSKVPYLVPPKENTHAFARPAGLNVGLVWAGNQQQRRNALRSVPFEVFSEILKTPGVNFFSLQVGERRVDLEAVDGVTDLGGQVTDLADTASLISQLDLVISVDTSVAHLAGALGRPVWVPLTLVADWRWGDRGETTPWYPTARLFRQRRRNEWGSVIDGIKEKLAELAKRRH